MKIIITWSEESKKDLVNTVKLSLDELGLTDFITLEESNDEKLIEEMSIKAEPALIIEEESIDFKDMIFEWQTPADEEIKAMLVSIIWGWDTWSSCAPGGCGSWCSC